MALYRPKGSKVWWYDFEFNGQRIRESTKSKSKTVAADAQRARRRELEENFNGIKKRDPPKTFSAAAAETLLAVRSKLSRNSLNVHIRSLETLNPLVGKKLLSDISMQDIETITAACLAHGDSNRYINMKNGTLRYILRRYKQWEHLGKDYKKLKERTDCGKELSLDEEKRLLEACRASASRGLYTAVTIGLYAGLRRDEVRLLRWSQINLEIDYLTVGDSKTPTGEGRIVPLIGPALEAMKEWASLFPGKLPSHYVFPMERYAVKSKATEAKIYRHSPGKPMGSWKRAWTTARRIAGVQIRFHDLRHTTVTRLLDAGCTLEQISPILGWSARTMTEMMKRYQHRSLENRRKTMMALVSQRQAVQTPYQVKALESLSSGNEIDILTMLRVLAEFAESKLNNSEK